MTFNAPSFFVGIGTVLGLLTFGFGGGVLVSGILSDNGPREPSRVERRAAASEAAPPVITTKPVPVAPAPTDLQASTPNSGPPKPSESANASVAQPPSPAPAQQTQPVTPAADTATPPLGPQQPVALVNPASDPAPDRGGAITQQAKRLSDTQQQAKLPETQQAKRLVDQRKNAERRKAERLRQRETKQVQQRETRQVQQRAPAGSSSEDEADNDVRGERPFFMLRERREFGGPSLFRFFDQQE